MPAITLSCTPIADKRNIHTEKQGGESGRRVATPDRPPCPRAGFPPRTASEMEPHAHPGS